MKSNSIEPAVEGRDIEGPTRKKKGIPIPGETSPPRGSGLRGGEVKNGRSSTGKEKQQGK